ncbi:hypothetical protein AGMMS50225_03010 [Betaproteobacteria bacterium]|nr:hypothetical protein AGMMS50225_03010 [Betaproteobacteria bacterium]
MATAVEVFVHGKDRKGIKGIGVFYYDGEVVETDKEGIATLVIPNGDKTAIYVKGFGGNRCIYDGYISKLPKVLVYEKS